MKQYTYVQYELNVHRITEGLKRMEDLSRERWVRVASVYCAPERVMHHLFERDVLPADPYRGG